MSKNNKFAFLERVCPLSRGELLDTGLYVLGIPSTEKSTALDAGRTLVADTAISQQWRQDMAYRSGHNCAVDGNYSAFAEVDREVPVSPVLVRDLAGRVVHIGVGPEVKGLIAWAAYFNGEAENLEEDALLRNVPAVVFPAGCMDYSRDALGYELVEQVFFTKFRTLDVAFDFIGVPSESAAELALVAGNYETPNLYPYKLRLDTFYQDGWRLPQVQMLYARSSDDDAAAGAGAQLLASWGARPAGQDYAEFLAVQGGSAWTETLFAQGCTIIPTFDACNGQIVVGRNFEIEDYWPGRAVIGLHEIAEVRPGNAPFGTILDVLRPGYVTASDIVQASVVVSDGSGYVSANGDDPLPLLPNLDLPHQRTSVEWGACWLPTHPGHFEQPAVWGWDIRSGYFMQLAGPVWDPLHYYYASVDEVVRAYAQPVAGTRWLVPVPEVMQNRFYPVVPITGFDTISYQELQRRREQRILPMSGVKQLRGNAAMGVMGANIGYHPLPLEFEYELEPFWAPELHPAQRMPGAYPEELQDRICGVIRPQVPVEAYLLSVDTRPADASDPDSNGASWVLDPENLMQPVDDALVNYPFLARYVAPDLEADDVLRLAPPPYLANPGRAVLEQDPPVMEPTEEMQRTLAPLGDGFAAKWLEAQAAALQLMQFRHLVYRNHRAVYLLAWWYGLDAEDMAEILLALESGQASEDIGDQDRVAQISSAAQRVQMNGGNFAGTRGQQDRSAANEEMNRPHMQPGEVPPAVGPGLAQPE